MGLRKKKRSHSDDRDDSSVLDMLKKIQQQLNFLERKIDRLTEDKEGGSERHHSNFSGGRRPSYGSKDRKFSRGYARDDDRQSDEGSSSGKKFHEKPFAKSSSKKSYGRSSGKPAGKSFGKPFGKPGGGKKKTFSGRKKV